MTENEPRAAVEAAQIVMIVQSGLGILLLSAVALLEGYSMWEKWAKLRFRVRSDRTVLWILGVTVFALAFYADQIVMYAHDWTGNPAGCLLTGRPFIPLLFVITKQFLYFFLYERAGIVHDSLKMNGFFFRSFRQVVAICIILGIPAAFYWCFFITFSSKVFSPEGICVLFSSHQGPIIAFAVLDLVLSAMLLFLFAYPLWKHLKSLSSDHNVIDDKLLKLMKRNMLLSFLITASTFCNLVAMVILLTYHGPDTPRDSEFWQIYAMFFPACDMLFSAATALAMSNTWMPTFLANKIKFKSTEDEWHTSNQTRSKRTTSKNNDTITPTSAIVIHPHGSMRAIVSPVSDNPMSEVGSVA